MLWSNRFLLGAGAFAVASFSMAANLIPADAQEPDTVTFVTHANKAALAYNQQQWAQAKKEFRFCIGLRPGAIEYYEGLYNTCMKSGEWEQVAYALEKMFAIDPKKKAELSYEYGQALFHVNRYDEAVPYLKRALAVADLTSPLAYIPKMKPIPLIQPDPARPVDFWGCMPAPHTADLTLTGAATKSECICLAEFRGYDKSDVGWNHPPEARYYVTEILKGPPLTDLLPVKYEFHDLVNTSMPEDWKFSDKQMPEKDSKWILFIEFAVPKRGMFELYQGSYGRQPANHDNLNQLNSLLDKYNMRNTVVNACGINSSSRADTQAPKKEMVHTMLLQIYEQRGSKEVAAEYQALIGLRPTDAKLYFRYGLYLEKAGDSRAVNEYRRAAALEPSNPDYQGALGNAYYRAKNYGAAAGAYRRATECDGGAKYMMKSQYVGDFDQNTFRLDQQRAYARYRKQLQDNQ